MKTKTIKQMYDELNYEVIRKIKAGDFTVKKTEKHVVTIEVEGLPFSFYRDWETDRKSTRLNSSHITRPRMPASA